MSQQAGMIQLTRRRADQIFDEMRRQIFVETDRLFGLLMAVQWALAVILAWVASPRAWAGSTNGIHVHLWTGAIKSASRFSPMRESGSAPAEQLVLYKPSRIL